MYHDSKNSQRALRRFNNSSKINTAMIVIITVMTIIQKYAIKNTYKFASAPVAAAMEKKIVHPCPSLKSGTESEVASI